VSAARTDRARYLNVVVETVFPFFRYSCAPFGRAGQPLLKTRALTTFTVRDPARSTPDTTECQFAFP